MSVTSAMYTGVTGLLANADGMNVIGNNLANVNTIGFKSGRILFSDMLSTGVTNSFSASQIGRGTQIQKIDNLFTQSSFDTTDVVTDLAIQGNSFFALKDPSTTAPVDQSAALLTKAGAFRLDSNLYLTNADGFQVLDTQGQPIQFSNNVQNILLKSGEYAKGVGGGLDQGSNVIGTAIAAIQSDISALHATIKNMAPLGFPTVAQTTALSMLQAAETALGVNSLALDGDPGSVVTPFPTDGSGATAKNLALVNSPTGATAVDAHTALASAYAALQSATTAAAGILSAGVVSAMADEQKGNGGTFSGYSSVNTELGKSFSRITKIEPNGLITYMGQDGLSTFYYNSTGAVGISNTTSNALTAQRLAIVSAADPSALEKVGGSLFKSTLKAGVPTAAFSTTSNSPNGTSEKIFSNSLEQSNVDMAAQFVKMILTQRAYSANSKTITTSDEMTQEVLALKR